jgi:hypothetical protein
MIGSWHECLFSLYGSHSIDDVASMVPFLGEDSRESKRFTCSLFRRHSRLTVNVFINERWLAHSILSAGLFGDSDRNVTVESSCA